MNNWIKGNPDRSGLYLAYLSDGRQKILSFAENLMVVDPYNFIVPKAGWYAYDSEYGCFEIQNVTHWMYLPEPPEEE